MVAAHPHPKFDLAVNPRAFLEDILLAIAKARPFGIYYHPVG